MRRHRHAGPVVPRVSAHDRLSLRGSMVPMEGPPPLTLRAAFMSSLPQVLATPGNTRFSEIPLRAQVCSMLNQVPRLLPDACACWSRTKSSSSSETGRCNTIEAKAIHFEHTRRADAHNLHVANQEAHELGISLRWRPGSLEQAVDSFQRVPKHCKSWACVPLQGQACCD